MKCCRKVSLAQYQTMILQLDVSDNGHVWGVNRGQNIYRWTGHNWQHIGGKAVQVTVGPSGVWVVNRSHDIYYRKGTYGDKNTAGSGVSVDIFSLNNYSIIKVNNLVEKFIMLEMMQFLDFVNQMEYFQLEHFQWTHIGGKLKWISSGRNVVVGVNSGNNIYYRTGMSAGAPTGSGWKHIGGKLMMIEIYENEVVGTNSGHAIYKCPVSGVSAPKQTKKQTKKPSKKSSKGKGKNSLNFSCPSRASLLFLLPKNDWISLKLENKLVHRGKIKPTKCFRHQVVLPNDKVSDAGKISLNEPYLEESDSEDQLTSVNSLLDDTTIKCSLSSMEGNVSLLVMLIKPTESMDTPKTAVMALVEDGLKTSILPEELVRNLKRRLPRNLTREVTGNDHLFRFSLVNDD